MTPVPPERVLVVIPCLNEEAHLPALLDQLLDEVAGALPDALPDTLIVVADGGSTDASRGVVAARSARHPALRLLDNPDRVQSAGVNRAVRTFGRDRDWLVRIDAHCEYPPGYVAGLIDAARANGATSVVVPMVTRGHACFQRAVAAAQNSVLGTGGSPHRHVVLGRFVDHGHHALMRIDLYRRAGGYDETYAHNEDAELDQRLLALGARIWLEPGLAITYFPRRALASLYRQYRGYGRGRARNLARHPVPLKLRQALPMAVAPAVLAGAVGLALAPRWPVAALLALPALAWVGASLLGGLLLGLRQRSACVALGAGLAAMTMHFGWSLGFLRARLVEAPPGPPPRPMEVA